MGAETAENTSTPSAARARDAAQDDAFAAGEGIVDGHAVRRRGQRGAVG